MKTNVLEVLYLWQVIDFEFSFRQNRCELLSSMHFVSTRKSSNRWNKDEPDFRDLSFDATRFCLFCNNWALWVWAIRQSSVRGCIASGRRRSSIGRRPWTQSGPPRDSASWCTHSESKFDHFLRMRDSYTNPSETKRNEPFWLFFLTKRIHETDIWKKFLRIQITIRVIYNWVYETNSESKFDHF